MLSIPILPTAPPTHPTGASGPWWVGVVIIAVLVIGYALYAWQTSRRIKRERAARPWVEPVELRRDRAAA